MILPLTTENDTIRDDIRFLIEMIHPWDDIEKTHRLDALDWIDSGVEIFRQQAPDIPNKHLVSYCVLFDEATQKILLVDHIKGQQWLPTGGHVDPGEHPQQTALRECAEELRIKGAFWEKAPLFLSTRETRGATPIHTDVSLWFVLKGDSKETYSFDAGEFKSIRWFSIDALPTDNMDPNLGRFCAKLKYRTEISRVGK